MCVIPIVGIVVSIINNKWREHGTSTQLFVIPIHHNMLSHIFATEVNECIPTSLDLTGVWHPGLSPSIAEKKQL